MGDAIALELLNALVDQADGRDAEHNPLALVQGHADDVSGHNGLARSRRHLHHGSGLSSAEAVTQFVDSVSLIIA